MNELRQQYTAQIKALNLLIVQIRRHRESLLMVEKCFLASERIDKAKEHLLSACEKAQDAVFHKMPGLDNDLRMYLSKNVERSLAQLDVAGREINVLQQLRTAEEFTANYAESRISDIKTWLQQIEGAQDGLVRFLRSILDSLARDGEAHTNFTYEKICAAVDRVDEPLRELQRVLLTSVRNGLEITMPIESHAPKALR